MTKALATRKGIKLAAVSCLLFGIIQHYLNWTREAIIDDIGLRTSAFTSIQARWIPRTINLAADWPSQDGSVHTLRPSPMKPGLGSVFHFNSL